MVVGQADIPRGAAASNSVSSIAPSAPAGEAIRVVVADVRRLIADALATLISSMEGMAVIGVVISDTALETMLAQQPDLLLVGVGADSPQALAFVRALCRRALNLRVVMVVDALEPVLVRFALEQGVSGLLPSDAPAEEIAESLNQVVHGHAVLPAGWQRTMVADRDEGVESLSDRQLEVLELVIAGYSYAEIALRLYITPNTVKSHVRSIYSRLGVHNRMAAARVLADGRSVKVPLTPVNPRGLSKVHPIR